MGWAREMVETGINEITHGIRCIDNYSGRGNNRTETRLVDLEQDIREIVEPHTQADPDFKNPYAYIKITAKSVRNAFKKKPLKKIAETQAIFDNVKMENKRSDENDSSLRISIDTKAKVNIGEFSRGGKTRASESPQAWDHDVSPEAKLVPLGILNLRNDQMDIIFGTSNETSNFIVDGLELWWDKNANVLANKGIKELVINLDNGPQISSNRTQFIRRMVEFSNKTGMNIRLIYYPPYP